MVALNSRCFELFLPYLSLIFLHICVDLLVEPHQCRDVLCRDVLCRDVLNRIISIYDN